MLVMRSVEGQFPQAPPAKPCTVSVYEPSQELFKSGPSPVTPVPSRGERLKVPSTGVVKCPDKLSVPHGPDMFFVTSRVAVPAQLQLVSGAGAALPTGAAARVGMDAKLETGPAAGAAGVAVEAALAGAP